MIVMRWWRHVVAWIRSLLNRWRSASRDVGGPPAHWLSDLQRLQADSTPLITAPQPPPPAPRSGVRPLHAHVQHRAGPMHWRAHAARIRRGLPAVQLHTAQRVDALRADGQVSAELTSEQRRIIPHAQTPTPAKASQAKQVRVQQPLTKSVPVRRPYRISYPQLKTKNSLNNQGATPSLSSKPGNEVSVNNPEQIVTAHPKDAHSQITSPAPLKTSTPITDDVMSPSVNHSVTTSMNKSDTSNHRTTPVPVTNYPVMPTNADSADMALTTSDQPAEKLTTFTDKPHTTVSRNPAPITSSPAPMATAMHEPAGQQKSPSRLTLWWKRWWQARAPAPHTSNMSAERFVPAHQQHTSAAVIAPTDITSARWPDLPAIEDPESTEQSTSTPTRSQLPEHAWNV